MGPQVSPPGPRRAGNTPPEHRRGGRKAPAVPAAQSLSAGSVHQQDCVRRSPGCVGAVSLQSNHKLWTYSGGTELLTRVHLKQAENSRRAREEHPLLPAASLRRPLLTNPNMLSTEENDLTAP
ncbi:unnamed protein product [Rangifer tarandus platyrhynchus]|uniref:Uncharacterized protein n=1 Tax=Rangifer tarandus platyrhynchus TaxID=3082113 RepID=A0AC59ZS99_RANTA